MPARLDRSVAIAAAATALVALVLYRYGSTAALGLAILPLLLIAAVAIVDRGRYLLFGAVFAIPLSGISALNKPLPFGGANIRLQDLIIVLLLGGWAFSRLLARQAGIPFIPVPSTPVVGFVLVPFGLFLFVAVLRGHYAYGASLVGQPLRLALYAAVILSLAGMDAQRLYRLLRAVFYSGTVVEALWGLYYLGTHGSQTHSVDLSTGGVRPLAITTGLYCAGALFLALLTIRASPDRARNWFHMLIAGLALFAIVLGFGRGVFASVGLVLLLILATSPGARRGVLRLIPLAIPFLCLIAVVLVQASPKVISSFVSRVGSSPTKDANVIWREKANEAVLQQFREQPVFGVGFGRTTYFFIDVRSSNGFYVPFRQDIEQDPHDGYLFLLAGGGIVTLVSFLLVLGVFGIDARRRYLGAVDDTERLIIVWAVALAFCFLFETASGVEFGSSPDVLAIWALLVTPAIVPLRRRRLAGGGGGGLARAQGAARP